MTGRGSDGKSLEFGRNGMEIAAHQAAAIEFPLVAIRLYNRVAAL
jgi:hypothetical protein